ncbi:MAG: DNA cytosine methyltransferase [Campylobacterota bacterium]|nr:DNA cytosine methyltransferase [Campylobacterota bacterium]
MTFIDLFAGIGGFRIAFESIDASCLFSAEIDKHACQTYKLNFNDNAFNDVSKIDSKNIPDFDILCAGFPCQPFSIAGQRKGFQDTRGTLFFDIERIIRDKKPKAFILENVKGLVSHDEGNTLKTILNTLGSSINGDINNDTLDNNLDYNVYYKVLNSKDYAVPQNRERIYIIGFKNKEIEFNFPSKILDKTDLNSILSDDISGSEISDTAKFNITNNLKNHKKYDDIKNQKLLLAYEIRKSRCTFRFDNLSPTLTAKMGTGGNNVPVLVNQMRKLTTRECLRIQGFPDSYKIEPNKAQSYKQIGNSVSVPVIKLLAKEIKRVIS